MLNLGLLIPGNAGISNSGSDLLDQTIYTPSSVGPISFFRPTRGGIRVHSGEIVEGRVVHLWGEKGVQMIRITSGDLVYNVPMRMLVDEGKSK